MRSSNEEKSPCTIKSMPIPDSITCPKCGNEVEIWTDEEETACRFCSFRIFKKELTIH